MDDKISVKIKSHDEAYEKVLKMKKDLEGIIGRLHNLDFTEKNNVVKDVLNLSEELDRILSMYDNL